MNPFEMVVAIVFLVTIGSVLRAKYGMRKDKHGNEFFDRNHAVAAAENKRLTDEVRTLKDRVAVLERVVTDNEGSLRLDHEIERLRDKNRS